MTYENKSMNEKLAKNHITLLTKRYGKKKRHEHYNHKAMTQNTNKTTWNIKCEELDKANWTNIITHSLNMMNFCGVQLSWV